MLYFVRKKQSQPPTKSSAHIGYSHVDDKLYFDPDVDYFYPNLYSNYHVYQPSSNGGYPYDYFSNINSGWIIAVILCSTFAMLLCAFFVFCASGILCFCDDRPKQKTNVTISELEI